MAILRALTIHCTWISLWKFEMSPVRWINLGQKQNMQS